MDPRDVLVEAILSSTLESLQKIAHDTIGDRLPHDFLTTLSDTDRIDTIRACLLIYLLTSFTVVPHVFQLRASLAMLNGRDTIIIAGTGSGKTLCLLIPLLL
jgi:ATP-dependent helicase YprA (DUF1998 family)